MEFGIASVAAVTAITYVLGMGIKASGLQNKWIPVACGGFGMGLGILAFALKMPEFPASDILTAAAVGAVSGLAATGIDQAAKMLKK